MSDYEHRHFWEPPDLSNLSDKFGEVEIGVITTINHDATITDVCDALNGLLFQSGEYNKRFYVGPPGIK